MSIQAIIDGFKTDCAQGVAVASAGQTRLSPVSASLQEYTPAHGGYAAAAFELRGMTAGIAHTAFDQVCAAIANACDGKLVPMRETMRRVRHSAVATVVSCHLAPKPVSFEFQNVEQARQHGFVAQAKNLFLNPGEARCYTVSEANGRLQVSRASDLDTDEAIDTLLAARLSPSKAIASANAQLGQNQQHFSFSKRRAMHPGMLVSYVNTLGQYDLGFTVTASAGNLPKDDKIAVLSMLSAATASVELPVDNVVEVFAASQYGNHVETPTNVAVASLQDVTGLETYYAKMRDLNPRFWQQWLDMCEKNGLDMVMLIDN